MFSPLLLPLLKTSLPTLECMFLVWTSLFHVTPLTVEHDVSQVTCISDVEALVDGMEVPGAVYRHLLSRANQGDARVDVVVAAMDCSYRLSGNGNAFAFNEELYLRHTARDPRLVDVTWRYRDWKWSQSDSQPATHHDIAAERVQDETFLTRLFAGCAGERPGSPRCLYIMWYVALTGHYELLEGRETHVEVIHSFDANIESLRAEIPYLRFDLDTRKYVLDEVALQSQTPVDRRLQEWVGRPAGPAPGWEGNVYVGTESE